MTSSTQDQDGSSGSDSNATGYVRVVPHGMVPPSLADTVRGGCEGVVRDGGAVELNDVDGIHLKLKDSSEITPGTRVYVKHARGSEWAKPMKEYEREQREKEAKAHLKARERRKEREENKREAEEFWAQYDIPFEWDVAIKGQRSGLLRGSSGTGRASNTVEHLYVCEAFEAGRLERESDRYLCDDEAKFRFDEGERRQGPDGESYVPPVTCSSCLDFMDRWKVTDSEN